MKSEQVNINNKTYTLHIAYQENESLRRAFNEMTFDFWEFTFESFFQSGYWDDRCHLFSLFENDKIVAHTTLTVFKTQTANKQLLLGQLGTVMTQPSHTNQGLSRFLMDYIFNTYHDQIDGYFLFANDSVLDFYPKFGFHAVPEFQASKAIRKQANSYTVQKLDLTLNQDLKCFQHYIKNGKTASRFDTQNDGISHFYCLANPSFGFSSCIYAIPELETLLIAQQEETVLHLYQSYSLKENNMDEAINALADIHTTKLVFGYTPIGEDYSFTAFKQEGLTLFVTPLLVSYFTTQPTMIPLLSHT